MQPKIIKVNDIDKSIQEVGLEYYVDRLLQDEMGDYFWVDVRQYDSCLELHDNFAYDEMSATTIKIIDELTGEPKIQTAYYKIYKIPKELAWFCIDALKLQSDVLGIGSGVYDEGPHGGRLTFVAIEHKKGHLAEAKIIPEDVVDVVRIEDL